MEHNTSETRIDAKSTTRLRTPRLHHTRPRTIQMRTTPPTRMDNQPTHRISRTHRQPSMARNQTQSPPTRQPHLPTPIPWMHRHSNTSRPPQQRRTRWQRQHIEPASSMQTLPRKKDRPRSPKRARITAGQKRDPLASTPSPDHPPAVGRGWSSGSVRDPPVEGFCRRWGVVL